jgi:glycosyltransferase involved in cell wall biosynthesis
MIKYSIIIATYNRLNELEELFSSLKDIDFPQEKFEVVIVDDGSNDGTKEFINSLRTAYGIQYLHQSNQGPGAARNLGMSKAKGEYFIFIDSDVLLPKDYLKAIDKGLDESGWDAFGGPDDAHESFSPLLKAINYSMTSFLGTGGTRGSTKSVTRFFPRSFNMGIHRRVFEKVGGMGGLRHGQDMDYSARIYDAGFKVGLIPDAVVYHKRRTSFWRFFKQIFNWGVARINLGRKHEGMLKPVHLLPAFLIAGVVVCILLAFFWSVAKLALVLMGLGAAVIAFLAFFQATLRYGSPKIGLLSILTLFIQVGAYGLGLWSAIFQVLQGKEIASGITKNYYK